MTTKENYVLPSSPCEKVLLDKIVNYKEEKKDKHSIFNVDLCTYTVHVAVCMHVNIVILLKITQSDSIFSELVKSRKYFNSVWQGLVHFIAITLNTSNKIYDGKQNISLCILSL